MEYILESRIGKLCIVAYTLFAILSYLYALSCGAGSCTLAIVWPILPWAFILASDFGLAFPSAMYPIFILLNASVVYVLGAMVEWLYTTYIRKG
jgi:hypothetical protein